MHRRTALRNLRLEPGSRGVKVALVHDWLTGMRGGEKVLQALCGLYPNADVFTLFYAPDRISEKIRAHRIVASGLNKLPGALGYYRYLLPLMPRAIESFDLTGYDLVISSSHAVAKGARVPAGARHICYCHTPMRYIWGHEPSGARRAMLSPLAARLRAWDVRASAGVTEFVANSQNVRDRISTAYQRDASVVYPPVDTDFFTPGSGSGDYYLVVSALEPYKRIDSAIEAAKRMGRRLIVAGRGTQARALRRLAGVRPANSSTEFLGWVPDDALRDLYRGCRALLFPGLEDFGMCPVEAQACGRPVIAYGQGGALESVIDGVTGLFFTEQIAGSLVSALRRFETMTFDATVARQNSLRFSQAAFEAGMAAVTAARASV